MSLSSNLTDSKSKRRSTTSQWYHLTFSPEHGVYIILFVSFLTGAAAAQDWTTETTLALISAFCGFQAEHPWVLQIKQRKSLKPRFLLWASVYTLIAGAIAVVLFLNHSLLLWIYAGVIVAFIIDAISVFYREQKSIFNEVITFAAVCLSAPFAFIATTGTFSLTVAGLWLLNTLFFSGTIFTVKFRKSKTPSIVPSSVYYAIATLITIALWFMGWLSPWTAAGFAIALCKFAIVLLRKEWYRTARIQSIAIFETSSALLFLLIVSLSLLPAHLSV
ncbi:YwiC-like family protein [Leptolyngbya sp. AN03gr2]|uniref:YwiC-like family protein n=1 Tax=unclassified Leptolyngbya TaxID=2650499 RepID=UPI003D3155BE